jgi:hypothetical protein
MGSDFEERLAGRKKKSRALPRRARENAKLANTPEDRRLNDSRICFEPSFPQSLSGNPLIGQWMPD